MYSSINPPSWASIHKTPGRYPHWRSSWTSGFVSRPSPGLPLRSGPPSGRTVATEDPGRATLVHLYLDTGRESLPLCLTVRALVVSPTLAQAGAIYVGTSFQAQPAEAEVWRSCRRLIFCRGTISCLAALYRATREQTRRAPAARCIVCAADSRKQPQDCPLRAGKNGAVRPTRAIAHPAGALRPHGASGIGELFAHRLDIKC